MGNSGPGVVLLIFVVLVSFFVPVVLAIWVAGTALGAFVGLFVDICAHERHGGNPNGA